jgi:arylsulfatase A-like enzyme
MRGSRSDSSRTGRSALRLTGVLLLSALLCGTGSALSRKAIGASRPPNVILIVADDLGWGDLHAYGNDTVLTPNLDRLAAEGLRFSQFYVTSPVCSPSRVSFMTGRFPSPLGFHNIVADPQTNKRRGVPDFLDPTLPTITRILHDAGYATAHFGKWHLGWLDAEGAPQPSAYGIDDYRIIGLSAHGPPEATNEHFEARTSEVIVKLARPWIKAHRNSPFFLNLWMLLPHSPLNPTPEQLEPYQKLEPQGVPYKSALAVYYASVTALDSAIGDLLTQLDDLELAQDTIVIFTSDNGPEDILDRQTSYSGVGSAGPFRGRKRSLYEGGIRTPLIVRWPGRTPAGGVDEQSVVSAVDFLPTIANLTGAPLPPGARFDGEDATDALLGTPWTRSKPLFWEWRFRVFGHVLNQSPRLAIRDGQWKLLMNPDRSRMELYDIPQDPTELANLSDRHADVVARLSTALLAWSGTLPKGPSDRQAGQIRIIGPRPIGKHRPKKQPAGREKQ